MIMQTHAHQETVAAYLSGQRRVPRKELAAALAAAGQNSDYWGRLSHFLGVSPDWCSDCHALRTRFAELAECSSAELARQFPGFKAHLQSCEACRHQFRQIKPLWFVVGAGAVRQGVARVRQRLTDGIQLLVSGSKTLVEAGIGPLSQPVVAVAATADTISPGESEPSASGARREWRIEDEDCAAIICLTATALHSKVPVAAIECSLLFRDTIDPTARIELVDHGSGRVLVAGRVPSVAELTDLLRQ